MPQIGQRPPRPAVHEAEQFEYLHVRQGHVKGLVDHPVDLHKEVLRLLGPSMVTHDSLFEEELAGRNEQIAQLREYLCSRDDAGDLFNSVEYHELKIRQNQALIKTLTTDETKQQVEEFTGNSKRLSSFETLAQDLTRLHGELIEYGRNANESIEVINRLRGVDVFDVYILTAPSVRNPLCYTEKRLWIEQKFDLDMARNLIISPNKGLNKGDYLIDDNINGKGQENFEGKVLHFGSPEFENWSLIWNYFKSEYDIKDE